MCRIAGIISSRLRQDVNGSIDAICNGELGKAINPDGLVELENALSDYLITPVTELTRRI
ncbi:hypothetical protein [Mucilaginibacter sp.]